MVSPELLHDPWTKGRLVPALQARFWTFPFRGAVLFLEVNTAVAHLTREPQFQFYEQLRSHKLAVTLTSAAVEANWELLSRHLVALDETAPWMPAMDEVEFAHALCQPAVRLSDADVDEMNTNIFEQSRISHRVD